MSKAALARSLGVSRQSLYYKPKRPKADEELRDRILDAQKPNPGYGQRRMGDLFQIGKNRAGRIMRKYHIRPLVSRKKRVYATVISTVPNRLKMIELTKANEIWVGDFTYLWFRGRYVYLATVIDSFTREVIGWQIAMHHTASLVIEVLEEALNKRNKPPQLFHSDQGSEYASQECITWLVKHKIQPSHSPKGKPWVNGRQESFFSTFKLEFAKPSCFATLEDLIEAIGKYIHYYNTVRIHSAHHIPPRGFYEKCQNEAKLAENPRD